MRRHWKKLSIISNVDTRTAENKHVISAVYSTMENVYYLIKCWNKCRLQRILLLHFTVGQLLWVRVRILLFANRVSLQIKCGSKFAKVTLRNFGSNFRNRNIQLNSKETCKNTWTTTQIPLNSNSPNTYTQPDM